MIIFEHIFKTGGTTFLGSIIPCSLKKQNYIILPGDVQKNNEYIKVIQGMPLKTKNKISFIGGHNACQLSSCFPNAKHVCLIRNPIERCVSAYLHFKHHDDAIKKLQEMNKKLPDFPEFISEDFCGRQYAEFCSIHNGQSKILQKAGGKKKFEILGVTELYDEFLYFLKLKFNLPFVLYKKRLVRNENKESLLTKENIEIIRNFNRLDCELFRECKSEFMQELHKLSKTNLLEIYAFKENNIVFQKTP